jgi:8-hydroxy-5-deazaflavin:NADPH oxidoreductase
VNDPVSTAATNTRMPSTRSISISYSEHCGERYTTSSPFYPAHGKRIPLPPPDVANPRSGRERKENAMNIAIIGTGNIGSGLATVLAGSNHGVVVSGRTGGDDLAAKLKAQGLRVQAADIRTAVAQADVVILAVPYGAVAGLADAADFRNKIVVDATNPVTEDFSGLQVGHTTSAAEEIAAALAGARVVKAFNTVFAQIYAEGLTFGDTKVQTFVASDDADAKAAVIRLATDAGFDARDAGPLKNARYIEPLAYLNIQNGYMLGQGTQIAPVWLSR